MVNPCMDIAERTKKRLCLRRSSDGDAATSEKSGKCFNICRMCAAATEKVVLVFAGAAELIRTVTLQGLTLIPAFTK